MKIQDLMTKNPYCCRADDNLTAVARILWERDCGCVPVLDAKEQLVGIVTDRDVCMAAYTQGKRLDEIALRAVMTRHVTTVQPTDEVGVAEQKLAGSQVRRLPVVDQRGKVVGLLAINDLLRAAAAGGGKAGACERLVSTLAVIGVPRPRAAAHGPASAPTVVLPGRASAEAAVKAEPVTAAGKGQKPDHRGKKK
ncbi:MAG TPA: CBS domain-containing protein [Planctomycetota bacterium]|nr:CBS domain-containing protein [Planctomycetota bacterium]